MVTKEFIRKYKLHNLSAEKLKDIIKQLGYTIVPYNQYHNNDYTTQLINDLSVQDYVQHQKSFTYERDSLRLVFIIDSASDDEAITLLLHEIGHIILGHTKISTVNQDIEHENQANQFSYDVKRLLKYKQIIKKTSIITASFLVFLLIMGNIILTYQNIFKKPNNDNIATTTSTTNQNSTITTLPKTQTTTPLTTLSKPTTSYSKKTTKNTSSNIKTNLPSTQYNFPADINTVSFEQLLEIPQIGEVTAQKIIDFRNEQGTIYNMDSLLQINGIGEVRLKLLKQYLYVDATVQTKNNITYPSTSPRNSTTTKITSQQTSKSTTNVKKQFQKVNLNTASAKEISDNLLIEMSVARSIISLRNEIGHFTNTLEILYVDGFTEKMYKERKDYLNV